MNDISRIRTLTTAGKPLTGTATQHQQASGAPNNIGPSHPGGLFRSLALTMQRAVEQGRTVCPGEVSILLQLFGRFWGAVEASNEGAAAESATQARFAKITSTKSVRDAYAQLCDDMLQLSQPPTKLSPSGREIRAEVEERYALTVGNHSVVCCAGVASAVADALNLLFETLGELPQYRELFPSELLRPCVPLLLTQRPTWAELLREHTAAMPAA